MKILIVSKNIAMMRGGGATRTLAFAGGLMARGAEVTLVHATPLFGDVRHVVRGPVDVRAIRSPYLRDLSYRLRKGRGMLPRLDDRLFAHALLRAMDRELPLPDLFLTFGNFPLAAALRRRFARPVVVSSAGGLPSGRVARHVRAVDAIVGDGAELTELAARFGVDPIEIRKGVDTEHFRPATSDARDVGTCEAGNGRPLRLLWTGRLVPVKNVSMALRALRELDRRGVSAVLTLAGAGAGMRALRGEARAFGVDGRVCFTGHVAWEALPAVYREADLFVLTSSFDNFPNSVLEAMASGLPVVSTRVGGVPLQVRDGENGLLVENGDACAMADAICRLARDPEQRRAMGERNRREAVASYGWAAPLDRLHDLCARLVEPEGVATHRDRVVPAGGRAA